jgi:hypothetical protein
MSVPIGEIVAADTCGFEAECLRLYGAPEFGSFVRVEADGGRRIYGVVAVIATEAIDASRRTQALRMTPEELAERMPQLELVLRTCFTAVVVGYAEGNGVRPMLPPQPPEIHRFVEAASPEEVAALTKGPDFLRMLAGAAPYGRAMPVDDGIAAAIRHAAAARGAGSPAAEAFVVACGKYLAQLFKRDFDRFEAIMRRLEAARAADAGPRYERPLVG